MRYEGSPSLAGKPNLKKYLTQCDKYNKVKYKVFEQTLKISIGIMWDSIFGGDG